VQGGILRARCWCCSRTTPSWMGNRGFDDFRRRGRRAGDENGAVPQYNLGGATLGVRRCYKGTAVVLRGVCGDAAMVGEVPPSKGGGAPVDGRRCFQ
jgi:hypothetical protein